MHRSEADSRVEDEDTETGRRDREVGVAAVVRAAEGENLHVDGGYNIMGSPGRMLDQIKSANQSAGTTATEQSASA